MPAPFNRLLHSSKFWLAVLACAQTVLFQFLPNFPQEVWQSIDTVLVIVIATIAVEDAAAKLTIFNRG
jgi:arginine exporter protein ArgO